MYGFYLVEITPLKVQKKENWLIETALDKVCNGAIQ